MPLTTVSKVKSARLPFANRDSLLWVYGTHSIGSSGGNGTASVGVNFSNHSQYPCQ